MVIWNARPTQNVCVGRAFALAALVAAAAAFIVGIAAAALIAGLYMDGAQRAVVLLATVKGAAFHAAADIGVGFFSAHRSIPRFHIICLATVLF